MMSQAVLATGAGVVADAEGVGVTQAVELGLAESVVGATVGATVAVVVGATVAVTVGMTVGAADEVSVVVGAAVGAAVVLGAVLGGAGWWWWRQRQPGLTAAAETLGDAEAVVASEVVPVLADDDTQAAPMAASLVALSFAPELDEKSIPAATPRTATSITAIAPMRARGRSSNAR